MKYSGKDVERVLEMYRSTLLSTREVARRCGVGRQSALDWIKAEGLSRARNASREYPSATRRRAIHLYNQGIGTPRVAAELGIPVGTVKNWVRNAGVVRSRSVSRSGDSRVRYDSEMLLRVGADLAAGMMHKDIAQKYGIPTGSIGHIIKRHAVLDRGLRRRFHKLDRRSSAHVVAA